MSSGGCRCGLATNMIWKAVPGSSCIREGPLAELGKCPRHDIVVVADDRRPQQVHVVAVATVCTVSERYDGRSFVVNGMHQCAEFKLHS